jgi:hypothetical protein
MVMVMAKGVPIFLGLVLGLHHRDSHSTMWLAREPGVGSGERGAGKKRAGSRDCHKKSRNR